MTRSKKATRAKARRKASSGIKLPALAKGERYAGILLDDNGVPAAHLILLAGELEAATWQDSTAWAKKQGGALPTRQEQALLFANLKKHFQSAWYWSSAPYAGDESWAWYQNFHDGDQSNVHKINKLRARAVRRTKI